MPPAAIAVGGALLGGIAGAAGEEEQLEINLGPQGALEKQAEGLSSEQLTQLQELLGQGPGGQDVQAGTQAARDFSQTLRTAAETGFGSRRLQQQAGRQAQAFLAPQREQLSQTFQDEATRTAQLAAQLGRSVDDPILQARLSTARLREEALLSSQEAGLTQQFGQQQLGLLGQATDIQQQLGQQAFTNRLSVLGAGQSALAQQQQFRLGGAGRTVSSGGGLGGALAGAAGGIGLGGTISGGLASAGITGGRVAGTANVDASRKFGSSGGSFGTVFGTSLGSLRD